MDGITREEMKELFEQFFGSAGKEASKDAGKNFDGLVKQIKESTDALKKQLPVQKQMEGILKGQRQSIADVDKELEALDKQIEELAGTVDSADKVLLQNARDAKASALVTANARAATSNFAVTMGDVAQTLIKGAFQYAKDLQSGASGVEAGNTAAATAARATGDAVSGFGSVLQSAGPVLSMVLKRFGWIGSIVSVAGLGLELFGKKAADISEAAVKFLGDELVKTTKAFRTITETGAVFGGGMTEMRNVAAAAGMDIAQLSTVVRDSKESLLMLGAGLAEGTKRIAGVSKELRTSELGIQLRKLGYTAEEQASLAADLMANQRAAGNERVQSDKSIAAQTAAYGKDLKILADITGQDAKKAAEKARITSMQADIMAKLGPKEAERFQAQLRGMPEALQKGFIQYVASGGQAVTDTATNILMAQQPEVAKTFEQGLKNIRDTSKTASDVQQEALEQRGRLGEAERQRARSGDAVINMANTLGTGVSGAVSATAELTNSLILQTQATEEAAKKSKQNAEAAANNMAPLDDAVARIEENAQKLKAAMGEALLGPLTTYAKTQVTAIETVEAALDKLGLRTKGTGEKVGDVAGGLAGGILGGKGGAALGAAIGTAILPGIGTMIGGGIGMLAGGAAGGFAGSWLGGKAGRAYDESGGPTKPMANGGIVDRPTRTLLGEAGFKEAVVPLPNGKSIPLDMNMDSIVGALPQALQTAFKMTPIGAAIGAVGGAMNKNTSADRLSGGDEQVTLLRDILDTLNSSKDLQQQYVYNTYN